jgi:hypothetical protein
MKKSLSGLVLAMTFAWPSHAAIEVVETPSSAGPVRQWWPKVTPPKGWEHDRPQSVAYGINAMVPSGKTFGDADTVMYARAMYRPREPQVRDVDALIDRDRRKALMQDPPRKSAMAPGLKTGDGKPLKTVTFIPARGEGNWERVAYAQEGDYFILFAVSSRTRKGYDAARPAFEQMLKAYRENP